MVYARVVLLKNMIITNFVFLTWKNFRINFVFTLEPRKGIRHQHPLRFCHFQISFLVLVNIALKIELYRGNVVCLFYKTMFC